MIEVELFLKFIVETYNNLEVTLREQKFLNVIVRCYFPIRIDKRYFILP